MTYIQNISNSFTETLKDTELQHLTIDLAESAIDNFLKEGLLKDIPVLGTLFGLYKTSVNIHDRLFTKKIIHFLVQLKDIPKDKRHKQIQKIEISEKYRMKLGEKILFILDKCDDTEKAELIGRLFNAYLHEDINYDDFLRTSSCIEKTYLPDLNDFIAGTWTYLEMDGGATDFIASGLMEIEPIAPEIQLDEEHSRPWDNEFKYTIKNGTLKCSITYVGRLIRKLLK